MLTHIARFEFRYLLRNPLFRATAAATFAATFVSISVDGFGIAEGGLLENSAYATLQKYVMFSVLFLFVATSFVATHLGPNRLVDHLYGYFLFALPNLLITSAILFALNTSPRPSPARSRIRKA